MTTLNGVRLVFTANTMWYAHNFLGSLITACRKAGAHVHVIAQKDECAQRLAELGCVCWCLPMRSRRISPIHDLLLLGRLYARYRKIAPSVALQFTAKPNIYGTLAAGALGIATINTVSGLGSPFGRGALLRAALVTLYRIVAPLADRTVFLNNHDRAFFTRRFMVRPDRITMVSSSGIDTDRFRPLVRTRADHRFTFLFHARLLWEKGVGVYLEAAAEVRRRLGDQVVFWLLGRPALDRRDGMTGAMLAEPGRLGPVEHLGFSADVREQLRNADCVVLPTTYGEGVPRSLLEAASMAIPIIGSDNVGSSDILRHGENGLVLERPDAEHLARAMIRMAATPEPDRRRMGQRGRAMAVDRFEEAEVVVDYLALAAAAMGRSARRAR